MKKYLMVALCILIVAINLADLAVTRKGTNVSVVKAVEQGDPMMHPLFERELFIPEVLEGENIALNATVTSSAFQGVFNAPKAIDGSREAGSYWEGAKDTYPNELCISFEAATIHAIRIALNPDAIWGPRVQTLSISYTDENGQIQPLVAEADYGFDPASGNEVVIKFEEVNATGLTLCFTNNTGASGGQVAELEVWGEQ